MTGVSFAGKDAGTKGDLKGMVDLLDGARVKPNLKSTIADSSVILGTTHQKKKLKFSDKEAIKAHVTKFEGGQPRHGTATLTFNLSSKKAFDEGWVVNPPPDADLEQNNLLEWATGRLQMAIKQKEEEQEYAKKKGCDKPTLIRHYGDSRRDTLMKLYSKSNESAVGQARKGSTVPKIPQLSKMDNTQRDRFMVQLPDGSTTLFYPTTGEVAVMASAVPNKPGELYVNCYDNNEERTCLGCFTPYGKSCCYHKNGVPAIVLSDKGGVIKSDDGSVLQKWTWPKYGKLSENIIHHLNKEMYIRIQNRENVMLHFSSNRETHKIQVGAVPGVESPSNLSPENMGVLQAGLRMSSKSALDYMGRPVIKEERPRPANRRRLYGMRKPNKKVSEIENLKKSLIPENRFEYESQADRELQRLQDKSKFLVEDWMEHYRLAVGISSPALKNLSDKPSLKSTRRKVRSAVDRQPSIAALGLEEAAEELIRGSTRFQSFRSPSAPPKHMVLAPKRRQSISSEPDQKTLGGERKTGGETPHVRIDVGENEERRLSPEKRGSSRHFQSASSGDSRSRVLGRGSQGASRHIRSSMIGTTMGSQQPQTPGHETRASSDKPWSPAVEACPVVTRWKLLNPESTKKFSCKCSKHRIPLINDIEFDGFIREIAPSTQLIVVSVTNSNHEESNPYSEMLENIYVTRNKSRTKPCLQCRHDQYRILRYDLACAHVGTDRPRPLQLDRHCVVPGMTLMYCGGRLLFADHIFNGYGNAKKDFRKQIFKCRQDFHMGHFLPDDFRFTPSRGKSGPRAAWGGEIGGTGVHGKGKPGLLPGRQSVPVTNAVGYSKSPNVTLARLSKSASYSTSSSSDLSTIVTHLKASPKSKFDTAREFVQFSLSTKVYVQPHINESYSRISTQRDKLSLPTETPSSKHAPDPVLSQMQSFLRMQTVK